MVEILFAEDTEDGDVVYYPIMGTFKQGTSKEVMVAWAQDNLPQGEGEQNFRYALRPGTWEDTLVVTADVMCEDELVPNMETMWILRYWTSPLN